MTPTTRSATVPDTVVSAAAEPWRRATSRAVHPSAAPARAPLAGVIAEGLAAVALPWELATGDSPTDRRYELLLSTDTYDAWLIHWPAGAGLEPHDHGGSAGAFAVVDGTLDEDVVTGGITATTRVAAGASRRFGADHVHAVVNRGDVPATSVHVYSPPLRSMGFYRRAEDGRLVVDTRAAGATGAVG